eukprot:XP_001697063.1 predicted protein [Chlamydomonas reinhardtii]
MMSQHSNAHSKPLCADPHSRHSTLKADRACVPTPWPHPSPDPALHPRPDAARSTSKHGKPPYNPINASTTSVQMMECTVCICEQLQSPPSLNMQYKFAAHA